jgi:hypothetical protein
MTGWTCREDIAESEVRTFPNALASLCIGGNVANLMLALP